MPPSVANTYVNVVVLKFDPPNNLNPHSVEITGDIASFISKRMVQGLGLTTTELVLARTSAIRYAGESGKPPRLINMMVRFGVDFLAMTPLCQEQLQGLRESS